MASVPRNVEVIWHVCCDPSSWCTYVSVSAGFRLLSRLCVRVCSVCLCVCVRERKRVCMFVGEGARGGAGGVHKHSAQAAEECSRAFTEAFH